MGACVGHRGTRVQSVVNELYDEKIDIVRWNEQIDKFIAESLSPAKAISVSCEEETKTALVIVPDNQLSLAIGKSGQNVRLAARLTGWRIDIRSESQIDEAEAKQAAGSEDEEADAAQETDVTAGAESADVEETDGLEDDVQVDDDETADEAEEDSEKDAESV